MRTRPRRRQLAVAALAGLLLAGCSGDGRRDAADAPTPTTTASPTAAIEGAAPAATTPGGAPVDPGAPTTTLASGAAPALTPGGTSAPAGGGTTGATTVPGSGDGASTPTSPAAAADPDPAPAGGTGTGSSDTSAPGDTRVEPTISATAEECAALNQLLGIVDHPDLRRLKVQTGC